MCGELHNRKNSLLNELVDIGLAQNTRTLSKDELLVRATGSWRQKSRILWLKERDINTRFFPRMATAHKRYNDIDGLIIKEEEAKDPQAIKVNIIDYYKKLYTESELWRPSFEFVNCPRISQEEQDWLQRPFTEEEVLNIIKQCDGDKVPGPDGYTMSCFKVCWATLKEDLMQQHTQ